MKPRVLEQLLRRVVREELAARFDSGGPSVLGIGASVHQEGDPCDETDRKEHLDPTSTGVTAGELLLLQQMVDEDLARSRAGPSPTRTLRSTRTRRRVAR